MQYKRFEDIPVWIESKNFVNDIYNLITKNPKLVRDFLLKDQLKRASYSIMLNVAEGFERGSNKEFANFLNIAKGSAGEVRSILYILKENDYINNEEFDKLYTKVEYISAQLSNFRKFLISNVDKKNNMITLEQQKWLDHLNTTSIVEIFPHDPKCNEKFEEIKSKIKSAIGTEFEILHRGSSSFGISGQREIDVYIVIPPEKIKELTLKMEAVFGKPKSVYPLERTKFLAKIDGTLIEIMLTNKEHNNWINGEKFHKSLTEDSEVLEKYKKLKEECAGVSTKEYYTRKTEFINDILRLS